MSNYGKPLEYIQQYYKVPACIGRGVTIDGKPGIITEDRGNYIGVTLDEQKPGTVGTYHPTDPSVVYGEMRTIRPMTKAQARYRAFKDAEWFHGTFIEFLKAIQEDDYYEHLR